MQQLPVPGMVPRKHLPGMVMGLLIVIGLVHWAFYPKSQVLTPEQKDAQFQAELTEQNQQADVASQLRAAEKGDLVEMLNGRVYSIWLRASGGDIEMADCMGPRDIPRSIEFWAKVVKRVVPYPSDDYAKIANLDVRCERTK